MKRPSPKKVTVFSVVACGGSGSGPGGELEDSSDGGLAGFGGLLAVLSEHLFRDLGVPKGDQAVVAGVIAQQNGRVVVDYDFVHIARVVSGILG
jgi:hypothetical protein